MSNSTMTISSFDPLLFMPAATSPDPSRLATCLRLVAPYLDVATLSHCILLNRHLDSQLSRELWRAPNFRGGYLHSPLRLLNRFIDVLPRLRPQTQALISILDLSEIEPTLYENVRPHLFEYLTHYTPQLQILKLVKTSFFSIESITPHTRTLPHLRVLDLSFCDFITDELLVALAPRLPSLEYLRLDSLGACAGGERGIAAFADHCGRLRSVSIRYNETIEDGALAALGKFGRLGIKEVDLTGCTRITHRGLDAMARFNINMSYLSLARTNCLPETACMFMATRSARYLRHLDLGYCRSIEQCPEPIAKILASDKAVPALESLAIPLAVAEAFVAQGIPSSSPVFRLCVHDVRASTTLALVLDLHHVFPALKLLTVTQDSPDAYLSFFDDDDDVTFFADETPSKSLLNTPITAESVQQFNSSQNSILVRLTNDRETIEGLTIHHW
ncbi:hypothetical protein BX666DRAFT_1883206 [Dichotomocladium elegans]|nr:hypothetical protein BX666DRAFT_1883206 [Dichotomocladium elegans]